MKQFFTLHLLSSSKLLTEVKHMLAKTALNEVQKIIRQITNKEH